MSEEVDHLGDPSCPLVGALLGGVDPTEVRVTVELRQPVEERSGHGFVLERGPDVVGEICTLRSFWREDDLDSVAGRQTAISPPGRAEHDPESVTKGFDRGSDAHSVDGAAHSVV